ncbi:MAG: right-handed parallel beta-helix repeat-containing protein [Anaerolineales bacterium]|jgi:parallel beta-helix repeat protein|nr:right-handed parallel beta-helix repeat-containing protein [Anaerolineales bacterium]
MNKRNLQTIGALVVGASLMIGMVVISRVSQAVSAVTPITNNTTTIPTAAKPPTEQATSTAKNSVLLTANVTGTYIINQSGTTSDPVVIDGNGFTVQCIKVTGSYVTVRNFFVENCNSHAILVLGNNVNVENNTVRYNITENGKVNCGTLNGGWGSGIKAEKGSHGVTIQGNTVYENCGEGIAATMSYNVIIENNTVWDNFSVGIYVDNSYNVTVRNNEIYCTGIYLRAGRRPIGIAFGEELYKDWGSQRHDNSAINNHINGCDMGIVSWDSDTPDGREIRLLIEGNRIFNTIGRSIELNTVNEDVLIRDNVSDRPVYVRKPEGVTLIGNIEQ